MIKIIRLLFLLLVKESYLLTRNLTGLVYHPFLTVRTIKQKRDFSQAALTPLALSLPFSLAVITSLIYLAVKYIFHFPVPSFLSFLVQVFGLGATIFLSAAFAYLFFWSLKVIRKNHRRFFWEGKRVC